MEIKNLPDMESDAQIFVQKIFGRHPDVESNNDHLTSEKHPFSYTGLCRMSAILSPVLLH